MHLPQCTGSHKELIHAFDGTCCCSESWVADLRKAVGDLSKSSAAQQSSGKVLSSLDDLGQAFSGKDIEKAKTSFEGAVTALSKWVSDAGLSQQIKGL